MGDYVELPEILDCLLQSGVRFLRQVPRKKIMFFGTAVNGDALAICSPQSKFHKQGFYWVDITEIQCNVMNQAKKGLVIFRLEGRKIAVIDWDVLKQSLMPGCMRYNSTEKNHWKLNIYDCYIKVSGNPDEIRTAVTEYI